jgi:hypothetical protein
MTLRPRFPVRIGDVDGQTEAPVKPKPATPDSRGGPPLADFSPEAGGVG